MYPVNRAIYIDRYVIPYGRLCEVARVPGIEHGIGSYLNEIAEWCAENNYPPINALAVNAQTRRPGEGYDGAGHGECNIEDWDQVVEQCIRFNRYPDNVP